MHLEPKMKVQYFAKITDFDYATGVSFGVRMVEVYTQSQADFCFISENGVDRATVEEYLDTGMEPSGVKVVKIFKDESPKSWSMDLFDPS